MMLKAPYLIISFSTLVFHSTMAVDSSPAAINSSEEKSDEDTYDVEYPTGFDKDECLAECKDTLSKSDYKQDDYDYYDECEQTCEDDGGDAFLDTRRLKQGGCYTSDNTDIVQITN